MSKREQTPSILDKIKSGGEVEKTVDSPKFKPSKKSMSTVIQQIKQDKPDRDRINIYIDKEIWKQLRSFAVNNETSASAIIEQLLRNFLSENE
ncbi:MAG: hypothetical protein KDE52_01085 [Calditrichaeota bacterium]|nr:hypothetical protein [Calditrichota bacterium]MCB0267746.1 hypothetical protein [Calditrichota bacterium]MCB0285023.1 hypothetical protein [Calditrichota bacterium]MCB0298615.1 hypothetical protein [Calditrichota bacterium]